jgi:hypothetical protein
MKADVKPSLEEQALEWATEHFRSNTELLKNSHEGKLELAKMESEVWFKSLEGDGLDVPKPPKGWLEERTQQALAGHEHATNVLSWLMVRYIAADKPIPRSLLQFAFYRLTGEFLLVDGEPAPIRIKQRPGKGPYDSLMRNMLIWSAITQINIKFGVLPTRSEATDRPSAASIVSKALKANGIDLSESGIEKLWEKRATLYTSIRRNNS